MATFAVGYFFLSGLEPLHQQLYNLNELRLLIGNTTNRETIAQISEGYRRLELVQQAIEAGAYPKRSESKARVAATLATDVLSEGLNLQDCDTVVNYDLHLYSPATIHNEAAIHNEDVMPYDPHRSHWREAALMVDGPRR